MHNLKFNVSHHYRMMKTIYETEDGASAFYRAFDEVEKRIVGIKSLKVNKKDLHKVMAEANTIHRFSTESKHIPALYQTYYDEKKERYYLIMQFIEGERTLEQKLKSKLTFREMIQILINLCDALIPLHRAKFQHRDLKPANILMDKNQLYLIDFNLTTSVPFKGEGTLYYRAPEQDRYVFGVGQDRADIFSIGVIFYEMVTGEVPILGRDYVPSRDGKEWRKFVSPNEKKPQTPQEINQLIESCMHIDKHKRPRDASELKRLLIQLRRRIK